LASIQQLSNISGLRRTLNEPGRTAAPQAVFLNDRRLVERVRGAPKLFTSPNVHFSWAADAILLALAGAG
jgi:hypothetical protein